MPLVCLFCAKSCPHGRGACGSGSAHEHCFLRIHDTTCDRHQAQKQRVDERGSPMYPILYPNPDHFQQYPCRFCSPACLQKWRAARGVSIPKHDQCKVNVNELSRVSRRELELFNEVLDQRYSGNVVVSDANDEDEEVVQEQFDDDDDTVVV